jgi:hypothetical protein
VEKFQNAAILGIVGLIAMHHSTPIAQKIAFNTVLLTLH